LRGVYSYQAIPCNPVGSSESACVVPPAATQHFVKRHQILHLLRLHLDHRLLCRKQRTLRIQHIEGADGTMAKTKLGQLRAGFLGFELGGRE
jgi:hypothetical protein